MLTRLFNIDRIHQSMEMLPSVKSGESRVPIKNLNNRHTKRYILHIIRGYVKRVHMIWTTRNL